MPTLEERKLRIEIVEKALVVATLVIAIATSAYKCYEFLSAKSNEAQQKAEAIQALTTAYTESLKKMDTEIKEIDDKLADAPWKGSSDWDKYVIIRDAKVRDRALLLEKLGAQIVDLKRAENK